MAERSTKGDENVSTQALVKSEPMAADQFMPAMNISQAVARRQAIVDAAQQLMKENIDYGIIPGTPKPTLLKPGAEKLCSLFGLSPAFYVESSDEDWTGERHGGEAFFNYRYKCQLARNGHVMGEGEGSCNSWESKYRYRKGERKCPTCGAETIIKGKAEYGGGWLCWKNKGGCGAKFKAGDTAIESQEVGRRVNPDIFDIVNTLQKMAQKRALIAATLIAINASEFFTQDVEDMQGSPVEAPEPPQQAPKAAPGTSIISEPQRKLLIVAAKEGGHVDAEGKLDPVSVKAVLARYGFDSSTKVTVDRFDDIVRALRGEPEYVPEENA